MSEGKSRKTLLEAAEDVVIAWSIGWDLDCVIATLGIVVQREPKENSLPSNPLIEVGQTSRGDRIYREANNVGGHRYWSDSIGGGVVIYDTCLASREELELAIKIEQEFEHGER